MFPPDVGMGRGVSVHLPPTHAPSTVLCLLPQHVPRKCAHATHPSPGSRRHPRSRSGCFGCRSRRCPLGSPRSWGWGRLWDIQLCHCPASPPSTDGIPSSREKPRIRLKIVSLAQDFCPDARSHDEALSDTPSMTPNGLGTIRGLFPMGLARLTSPPGFMGLAGTSSLAEGMRSPTHTPRAHYRWPGPREKNCMSPPHEAMDPAPAPTCCAAESCWNVAREAPSAAQAA